ncbi:MAG: GGDEF domain-containing protein [bacterium]|nr:GGDEF domain-containing protein [bacterium]
MSEYDFLYKIMYEMTTVFESSKSANELILGLKQVFKNLGSIKDLCIFTKDEITNNLINFAKNWESLIENEETKELLSNFEELKKGENYLKKENVIYFPLAEQRKINGVVRLEGTIEDEILKKISPLLTRQISLAVIHLKYFEKVRNNAKFYETIRNITKITETQYDLSYVLPIMGEMIDGFIREHLIYIFLKKSGKKEYRLVWPSKCTINNISDYLSEIKDNKPLIKDGGKTCIFPLIDENKPAGAIVAYNPLDKLNENEVKYLEQLSVQASTTVNKAKEYMKILENATLDALTGLNNRHLFHQRLSEATANAKRQKTNLCCIMTDIDFFKSVNDTYGHAIGDLVLKTVAKTIKKELREYDIPSRYGGEEFAVLLPDTPIEEAFKVAQRLREKIEKKKINISEYKIENVNEISVTISIGVAAFDEKTMKDPSELYRLADKGLYIAKESGRNRVIISEK